ncbi:hypothetical protein [Streptomyces collinus]|uniref:hypothetical protein n=1 Tax=Streptomyces collinus TaxID=42684 RepID=UPI0033FC5379
MSHPTGEHHQRHFPTHDAPQPKFVQHPPEMAIDKATVPALPPTTTIHVIITGPINIASAVAKGGGTSKIGGGENAVSDHAPRSMAKIGSTVVTLIMVTCAIIGAVVQLV